MISGILYSIAIGAAIGTIILAGSVSIIGTLVAEDCPKQIMKHSTRIRTKLADYQKHRVKNSAALHSLDRELEDFLNKGK